MKLTKRLSRPANLTRYVKTVRLRTNRFKLTYSQIWMLNTETQRKCLITGWGRTNMYSNNSIEGIYPETLQATDKLFETTMFRMSLTRNLYLSNLYTFTVSRVLKLRLPTAYVFEVA